MRESRPTPRSDPELVAAYLAGDPGSVDALGAMYDRYAPPLHDTAAAMLGNRSEAADVTHDVFVLAAERLAQLRDPSRLRAWLYAILRNEVYRRTKGRRRSVATDFGPGSAGEAMATPHAAADSSAVELADLARDLRDAARGLDERDQFVLELVTRQNLSGEELATALGVSVNQSYVVVSRMRDRVERSLGALAVARAGRRRCADLDAVLAGWDGTFSVLVRKRVARHIENCPTCADTKRSVGALSLVAAAPALALPTGLRDRVLASVAAKSTTPLPRRRPTTARSGRITAISATAAAVLVAVAAWLMIGDDGEQSATSPSASAPTSAPVTVAANAPPTTLGIAAPTPAPTRPPATSAAPTTTQPATTTTSRPTTTTTRPATTTTTAPGSLTVGGFVVAATTAPPMEGDPPRVELLSAPAGIACPSGAGPSGPVIDVLVTDASPIDGVELSWSGPGSPGSVEMDPTSPARWRGQLDLDATDGTWVYVVTASDRHGNAGTATGNVVVSGCSP